jgi:hypothetical protein
MNRTLLNNFNLTNKTVAGGIAARLFFVSLFLAFSVFAIFQNFEIASAQSPVKVQTFSPTPFRIGERLTYNVSFEKFNNAAYAEIYAVSRGKLGEKDAVELRSKIKTNELVSAAFYLLDESRTTYAASDSGLPLYVRKTCRSGIEPKETVSNFLVNPTAYNDLLTLIYQARNAGGNGSFSLQENDKIYNAIFTNSGVAAKVKTGAGEFETSVSNVQSDYLVEKGITNLRINFSSDEAHVPVLIQFKTTKGDFRAELASVQTVESETTTEPTPIVAQTPRPVLTPKPTVTPTPYLDNQPLASDLPFALGETLEYQISTNGQMLGIITLQVAERKQIAGEDSLLLTATVTETEPRQQIFKLNDAIRARVNPISLAPQQIELKLNGLLAPFNQQILFDQKNGD